MRALRGRPAGWQFGCGQASLPQGLFQPYEIETNFTTFALARACLRPHHRPIHRGVGMGNQLFAAVRRGKLKPGMAGEYAKRIETGALPILKKMHGFNGYYLIVGADDTITAVSLFTNKATAEAAMKTMMAWIKVNLAPLLAAPIETVEGTVLVAA